MCGQKKDSYCPLPSFFGNTTRDTRRILIASGRLWGGGQVLNNVNFLIVDHLTVEGALHETRPLVEEDLYGGQNICYRVVRQKGSGQWRWRQGLQAAARRITRCCRP